MEFVCIGFSKKGRCEGRFWGVFEAVFGDLGVPDVVKGANGPHFMVFRGEGLPYWDWDRQKDAEKLRHLAVISSSTAALTPLPLFHLPSANGKTHRSPATPWVRYRPSGNPTPSNPLQTAPTSRVRPALPYWHQSQKLCNLLISISSTIRYIACL